MVTMNDLIKIEMTLTQLHLLRVILNIYKAEHKEYEKGINRLIERLDEATSKLDYTDNERLVDEINAQINAL